MDHLSPHESPVPERRLPAWSFSILFHVSTIALLVLAVDRVPRGAAEEPGRTAGIVLKQTSAQGDLYEGEIDPSNNSESTELTTDELLAALPSDSAAADWGADLPQLPTAGPGAIDAGQPDAGQFTTGGGRRGSLDGSGQARVSLFGVEGTGTKFVYVFDRSGSMQGGPIAAAKRQLIESLQSLDSTHQFQIIFFNHQVHVMTITGTGERIAFATDRNKQLAANFVGGITADGGTDRLPALLRAIALQPDVIFFLTDADDVMPPSELAQIDRANRRAGATICVIDFGAQSSPPPRSRFLKEMAEQSGGQYGYIDASRLTQ